MGSLAADLLWPPPLPSASPPGTVCGGRRPWRSGRASVSRRRVPGGSGHDRRGRRLGQPHGDDAGAVRRRPPGRGQRASRQGRVRRERLGPQGAGVRRGRGMDQVWIRNWSIPAGCARRGGRRARCLAPARCCTSSGTALTEAEGTQHLWLAAARRVLSRHCITHMQDAQDGAWTSNMTGAEMQVEYEAAADHRLGTVSELTLGIVPSSTDGVAPGYGACSRRRQEIIWRSCLGAGKGLGCAEPRGRAAVMERGVLVNGAIEAGLPIRCHVCRRHR